MTGVVSAAPSSIPPGEDPVADSTPPSPSRSGTNFLAARAPLDSSPLEGVLSRGRSWGDLYRDHADFVWKCLRRMGLDSEDSADALHEVFLIVHRREAAFDPSRGTERGWLFGISANVVRAERRKKRPQLHADGQESSQPCIAPTGDIVGESSWRSADGVGLAAGELLKQALRRAIDDLSPEHRAVFTMFEIEGVDCRLIAEELEVPVGTVYSRLHKAREDLRSALSEFRAAPSQGGKR
jgi:RNA polymerase sigma-70 factor (ECF subfamily)